jgi:uncharacterized NAD(P)/FAD-binding protein YdhS
MPQFDIAIIGGGFSGTILAVQLLRGSSALSIGVIDRGSQPGRGLAYSSPHKFHLLNVPAGEMSALPDVPYDFLQWARTHHDPRLQERSFPPRSVYGAYVGNLLEKARAERGRERVQWLMNEALSVRRRVRNLSVQTAQGPEILARAVVIATGNFPPASPRIAGLEAPNEAYFAFPWSPKVLQNLNPTGSVLMLGSGLTSLDLIMALKSTGFRGTIHVLSRKGLFPRARRQQRPVEPWPVFWNNQAPRTVRGLIGLVREQVHAAAEKGIDWRAIIDSLRPVTQDIWQSLSVEEKRRFVQHVRPFWDVHRHRAAPEIADLLADMQAEGQVQLHTGVFLRYSSQKEGAQIRYWNRQTGREKTLRVDRVVNCSGSEADCRRIDDSLISSLFAQGLARPNPLFLGLDVDDRGGLINYQGIASRGLYAIGPPRKGCVWETTTVPDIRMQAIELAQHLTRILEGTAAERGAGQIGLSRQQWKRRRAV